jgi:UDPglucose 6-dehydrogenase
MKIGIVGLGVVGSAVRHGFERIGHQVKWHDIKEEGSTLQNVLDTIACFICVPTNSRADGGCDVSIVQSVVRELHSLGYQGLIAIKSTVVPRTTAALAAELGREIVFCPEFLRERAAFTDFVENHDVCIIGSSSQSAFELIKEVHGELPKAFAHLTPTEAELSKYFSNIYNALHITFANAFYEVCKTVGADYTAIKSAMVKRSTIADAYLDCNENFRGFGGYCLPKDTEAFHVLVNELGLDIGLFKTIVEENKKFKRTTPDGMRP